MARYYFHIRDHERLIVDEEGLELESLEDAIAEARRDASSMLTDGRASGEELSYQVMEVTGEDGTLLATVPFADVNEGG